MDEFRTFVLAWLERRGWTQARLAEATEISQSLVSKHLTSPGRQRKLIKPSPENLKKYAAVLDVSYEDLMRMCGYLPGKAELAEANDIEADVRARTAELMNAVKGAPPAFWEVMIRASFDMANEYARNMAQMLSEAGSELSANRVAPTSANRAGASASNSGSRGPHRPIKPRHQTFGDRALVSV